MSTATYKAVRFRCWAPFPTRPLSRYTCLWYILTFQTVPTATFMRATKYQFIFPLAGISKKEMTQSLLIILQRKLVIFYDECITGLLLNTKGKLLQCLPVKLYVHANLVPCWIIAPNSFWHLHFEYLFINIIISQVLCLWLQRKEKLSDANIIHYLCDSLYKYGIGKKCGLVLCI